MSEGVDKASEWLENTHISERSTSEKDEEDEGTLVNGNQPNPTTPKHPQTDMPAFDFHRFLEQMKDPSAALVERYTIGYERSMDATNGIVIATEKKSASSLVDDSTVQKIEMICANIGMVYSGMGPDFRVLVSKARKAAQAYKRVYMEEPPVRILVQEVASVMQEYTQSGGVRPFGVSILIAGFDEVNGPALYQVDPTGSYFAWKASAIGKNMINAKTFLEKRYNEEMELEDAVHTAILTLKEGFEGQMTENSLEIGIIGKSTVGVYGGERKEIPLFRKLSLSEVRDYLANIA
ncbi:hypothetical protein G6F56_002978 [Rhizopus delemar]|nr:hypothetical protein G6F56_002978 [Rhizopus delemar]